MRLAGVYFLSDGRGRIKIGASWNIEERARVLTWQFKCAEGLLGVIECNCDNSHPFYMETQMENLFKKFRSPHPIHKPGRTEWYRDVYQIRRFILLGPKEINWERAQ